MDQHRDEHAEVDHQRDSRVELLPEPEQGSELRVLTLEEIRVVAGGIGYYSDGGFGRRILSRNAKPRPCTK